MKQIENILSNRQLYKKAYLIEFYDDNSVIEAFTFSVPPESEELTYTQRKTETKTFNGLHVDEYGTDAVKVSLSGSTINQSLKRIYKGGFGDDKYLSGEDEIYYLRKLILEHKDVKKHPKSKVYVYDLSKYTGVRLGDAIPNCWQAFLGDFKIRRSNDKPFTYKYTLEFTGVPITGKPQKGLPLGSDTLGFIQTMANGINEIMGFVSEVQSLVDDVLGYVDQVSALMNMMGDIASYATSAVTGIMDSVSNAASGLMGGATNLIKGADAIMSLPRAVQLKGLNIGLEMQCAAKDLMLATESLTSTCRGVFTNADDYWAIPKEVLDQYAVNAEELSDIVSRMCNDIENAAAEIVVETKSADVPDVSFGETDPVTDEPKIILVYGNTDIVIDDTDSLESLASEYLGSPDRAIEIASYNNITSLENLEPGTVIKIPITKKTETITNNLIFARREDRDNYGRDIFLTDKGNFVINRRGDDYELVGGVKNLSQAVLLRLRESVNKRIRITAYGIRTNISDPTAGIAYVISSIELTVNNEPRVASVDNISFKGEGDNLNVTVNYTDINNTSNKIGGRI